MIQKRKLPPLTGLVAADAVARLTSFSAAADELSLTPSAISHRIRTLESWLGFALFTRNTRSVTLTTAGHHYLNAVAKSLSGLETITTNAKKHIGKRQIIRLQTTDSFANRWLVDRLPIFLKSHSDISVQIITREFTEGFRTTDADIAILYGRGDWKGCITTPFIEETIFPVVSPKLVNNITVTEDFFQSNALIYDDNLGTTWTDWWRASGVESGYSKEYEPQAELYYNHSHLALKAAEQGNGIALASEPLVIDALKNGLLIQPFEFKLRTEYGYYLLQRHDSQSSCLMFINWLLSEINIK